MSFPSSHGDRFHCDTAPRDSSRGGPLRFAGLVLVAALLRASTANATSIIFSWGPASAPVAPGTTEILVNLLAAQQDGADAAFLTLGFLPAGAITGVELVSYGPAVSSSDSFFTPISGTPALLASAPASPGSFGVDVDFTVAILRLLVDTNASLTGSLAFVDLTSVAGAPALKSDGITLIDANLSAVFALQVVPEAGVLWLVGLGFAGFGLSARRRR